MQIHMPTEVVQQEALLRQTMLDMGLEPAEIFSDGWGKGRNKTPASDYSVQILGVVTGEQLANLIRLEIVTLEGATLTLAGGYITTSIEDDQPILDLTFG